MPIDPSIIFNLQQPKVADPTEQAGRALNLVAGVQQAKQGAQSLESGALSLQQQKQDMADEQVARQIHAEVGENPDEFLKRIAGKVSEKRYATLQQAVAQHKKEWAATEKDELANIETKNQMVADEAAAVLGTPLATRQQAYLDSRSRLIQKGLAKREELPADYPGDEALQSFFAVHAGHAKTAAAEKQRRDLQMAEAKEIRDAEQHSVNMSKAGTELSRLSSDAELAALRAQGKDPNKSPDSPEQQYLTEYAKTHPGSTVADAVKAYKAIQPPDKPAQTLMMIPDDKGGYVARLIGAGQAVPEGAINPSGMSALNTPTAATRTMAESAPKVLSLIDKVGALVDKQKGDLGPAASRWAEFMAGKVGAPNEEFTKLRTDVGLLQTLLMRMHVGARGGEAMIKHFADLIDASKQSPENLKAALGEIRSYAEEVARHGKSGSAAPAAEAPVEKWDFDASGKLVKK